MIVMLCCSLLSASTNAASRSVSDVFEADYKNQLVLEVEAAMALAQAAEGIIPQSAANEIAAKADTRFANLQDIAAEYKLVEHRMVALLNVWGRSLEGDAAQYLHFGATTVDIYDTVKVLQLRQVIERLLVRLDDLEVTMLAMAEAHKDTVMVGRTLGQHALPITFGKKVSTWLAENRRNMERLKAVKARLDRSAILKGAVGSYLGLGDSAIEIEQTFATELGLASPYIADWHGVRDVFGEYALVLSLISKSWGRIGNELFLLQMTDIGETVEVRVSTAVGSSTMPHKNNPGKSEALVHYARSIPRLAEVILDDVGNYFERDNTSRPNRVLEDISIEADAMLRTANRLLKSLQVNEETMALNLQKTNQLIMSQRVAFALADQIGKQVANDKMHAIAKSALENHQTLRRAFEASELAPLLSKAELDRLLDVTTYTGLASEQTTIVVNQIKHQRELEGH